MFSKSPGFSLSHNSTSVFPIIQPKQILLDIGEFLIFSFHILCANTNKQGLQAPAFSKSAHFFLSRNSSVFLIIQPKQIMQAISEFFMLYFHILYTNTNKQVLQAPSFLKSPVFFLSRNTSVFLDIQPKQIIQDISEFFIFSFYILYGNTNIQGLQAPAFLKSLHFFLSRNTSVLLLMQPKQIMQDIGGFFIFSFNILHA